MQRDHQTGVPPPTKGILPLSPCLCSCTPDLLPLCSVLREQPCGRGTSGTLYQPSSPRRSGSPTHLSGSGRRWLGTAHPHSTRTACHVHASHHQGCFVCSVSGSTRSPRATGPPRHSRSQGEPDLCQATWSLVALHEESRKPK